MVLFTSVVLERTFVVMNIDNSMSANSLVVVVADIVIVKFVLGDVEAQFLLHVDAENSENNKASYDDP